jgi:hypothetical protein
MDRRAFQLFGGMALTADTGRFTGVLVPALERPLGMILAGELRMTG